MTRKYGGRVTTVVLSTDKERGDLEKFVAGRRAPTSMYRVSDGTLALGAAIAQAGGSYRGAIPYTAVFVAGRLVNEWTGTGGPKALAAEVGRRL